MPLLPRGKAWDYAMHLAAVVWFVKEWRANSVMKKGGASIEGGVDAAGKKKKENYKDFRKDLRYLVKVAFESWHSRNTMLLFSFVGVLLARTLLSLVVADVDGFMVKQLINKDKKNIIRGVIMWLAIALPSSFINSLIKYLQSRLALGIREKLTAHMRDLYFANDAYFRVSHLDRRVPHPEHAMTEDIAQWADRLADIFSSLGKPLVDLLFFSSVLFKSLGFTNQFLASVFVWETGKLMKWARPDFATLVQQRGTLEAELRFQHTRVINASEEIAFCKGDAREKAILERHFDRIGVFTRSMLKAQIGYYTLEDFVTKYLWTVVGLVQVAIPLLKKGTSAGDNAKYFITIRRMMVRNGDATERLLVGVKDVHEFAGFTKRVMEMVNVFKDQERAVKDTAAVFDVSDDVVVTDLPIVTPTGDLLIEKMNIRFNAGDRVLILGPNGCGKSSLFRILCGLWPAKGGRMAKPASHTDLFFLPQKPYLVQGTFRDQIIYPHTKEEMVARGVTDADLWQTMRDALMDSVLETHGGLDAVKEWGEVLSGGEKQRLGIARVMYHRPKFAILDECSSAINVEAEQAIFEKLLALGMGLITISHRHTLFRFHTKLLCFDGAGNYHFNETLQQTQLDDLTARKSQAVAQLSSVLKELGEDWPKAPPTADGVAAASPTVQPTMAGFVAPVARR